jgi:hypothetical protein
LFDRLLCLFGVCLVFVCVGCVRVVAILRRLGGVGQKSVARTHYPSPHCVQISSSHTFTPRKNYCVMKILDPLAAKHIAPRQMR